MKKIIASILAAATLAGSVFALDTVASQKGISPNGIKKIQINLKAESVVIAETKDKDNSAIDIEILSNYTAAYPLLSYDGKVIKIEQKEKTNKLKDRECKVLITVPKDFKIQETDIKTDSADISVSGFTSQKMDLDTNSGKITVTDISANDLRVSSDKGDTEAKNLKLDKILNISSTSGNLSVSNIKSVDINAETQKGNMKFDNIEAKKVSFNADKGVLDLRLEKMFEKDSVFYVSSGKAKITLPSNASFWTTGALANGRFKSEFTQNSEGPLLTWKVGGGDMSLLKD